MTEQISINGHCAVSMGLINVGSTDNPDAWCGDACCTEEGGCFQGSLAEWELGWLVIEENSLVSLDLNGVLLVGNNDRLWLVEVGNDGDIVVVEVTGQHVLALDVLVQVVVMSVEGDHISARDPGTAINWWDEIANVG